MTQQSLFEEPDETEHALFFAIRPDGAAAAKIGRLAQELNHSLGLNAKPMTSDRLHVSLYGVGAFTGALPPTILSEAKSVAATVAMTPFKVEFSHVASYGGRAGNYALVLVGDEGVAGLTRFQQSLGHTMMKAGLGRLRQPAFSPHLTMMYTDPIDKSAIEPISWIANEFVLIDSLVGKGQHILLGRWPS